MKALSLWNYDLDDACYRARLMASLAGVPLDLRSVDAFPGMEHRGPAMRVLTPMGRLPVLKDGDLVLTQVEPILLHLARTGARGGAFLPADGQVHARMEDWLAFHARDMGAAAAAREAALFGGDPGVHAPAAREGLRVLEDHMAAQLLRGQGFFAGPAATVADVALFPAFALSRDWNLDHDGFPALRLWARRVRRLPGFVTMPGIPDYH
jgi:glutathione S-transferase